MHFNFIAPNTYKDEELVTLVQSRNEAAFAELMSRYSPKIWNLIVQNSRQRRDAEEILLDIWYTVWDNIMGLRKTESFGGWLRRIAYTACNRYYATNTQRNTEALQYSDDIAFLIDREAEQRFKEARIRADAIEAVHNLPHKVRSIAIMYYLDQWSIKKIAEELDIPIGTIKSRLTEIRRLLRKEFQVEPIEGKNMSINIDDPKEFRTKLKIIGVGGTGCNVIKQMMNSEFMNTEYYAIDTDHDALITCVDAKQIKIDNKTLRDIGTDGNLELSRGDVTESLDEFRAIFSDAKMAIVIAGMGGETGTSVTPLISSIAREQGVLTVCFVTQPLKSEGEQRHLQADIGVRQLQSGSHHCPNAVIIVPNERLINTSDPGSSKQELFERSNSVLQKGVESIINILVESGEIQLDLADLEETFGDQRTVLIGIGHATGENRAVEAAINAIASPLLDGNSIDDTINMIVHITSPPDFKMRELDQTMSVIVEKFKEAQAIFAMTLDDNLDEGDEVCVTLMLVADDSLSNPNSTSLDNQISPYDLESDNPSNKHSNFTTTSKNKEFVHLHNHSEYSLLDGVCRIPEMVHWAIENSSPALALTDHGNMFGAIEFYKTARDEGVNPIVGCEVNVKVEDSSTFGKGEGIPYDLTLLAENNEGYHNLLELTSLGYTHGFHRVPYITMEMLREYHSGIIALTGCINGLVPKLIHSNQRDEAIRNLLTLKDIMGEAHLYVEIQNHYMDQEMIVYPTMVEFAKEYNIPIVGTNDCHYLRKTDHRMHDILLCIKGKKPINDPDRIRFNNHFYFKNVEEMENALREYPSEAIINTVEIAERCNLRLNYDDQVMPKFDIPEGYTPKTYLRQLCNEGLYKKYGNHLSEPIRKRMDYELDVIDKTGSSDIFLIVADYVNYANKQGHLLLARGTAASSLVLYALGVTNFNPMDYRCLFERFLNLEWMKLPSINIDFSDKARDDVIDYIVRKYGHDSVGKIATFTTFGVRDAIKNVGRVLEISNDKIKELTDLVPSTKGISLDVLIKRNAELQRLVELPENRDLIEISRGIVGTKHNVFCHSSAIAIANGPLTNYVPLFKDRMGKIAAQFEGKDLENIGLVRFDSLGVRSLSETTDCLEMISENHNVKISLEDIPLDDVKTYSLFGEGLLAGIFQFDTSQGIRQVVAELRPENFEELSAILSLYRPSTIHHGILQMFIDRKHGNQPIEYIHPSLKPVMNNTYGICLYQEQFMQIVCDIAGFSLGKAEILRKAINNKDDFTINEFHSEFIDGSMNNGMIRDDAQGIFDYLNFVGEYVFNRSHAIAYSLLAYRMAYLKVHYPHEFMTVIMNSRITDSEKLHSYKVECSRLKDSLDIEINLLPLDINNSSKDFTIDGKDIRVGLLTFGELNEETVDSIITERNRNGSFISISDFEKRMLEKTLNRELINHIAVSGAFDSLPR